MAFDWKLQVIKTLQWAFIYSTLVSTLTFSVCLQPLSNLLISIFFPPARLSVSQRLGKTLHVGSCCKAVGWQAARETERSWKSWSKVQKRWSGNREEGSEKCNSCESTGGSPALKNQIKQRERSREKKNEWEGRMCLTAGLVWELRETLRGLQVICRFVHSGALSR